MPRTKTDVKNRDGRDSGNGATLWAAANEFRGRMDSAEYGRTVLGLVFLRYLSEKLEAKHAELTAERPESAAPGNRGEHQADKVFWIPKEARWDRLASVPAMAAGRMVDDAMTAVERENPSLMGVFPKDYARPALEGQRLRWLIDAVGGIGEGQPPDRTADLLVACFKSLLDNVAAKEFGPTTPSSLVRLLVEAVAPLRGPIYDPCCGIGAMLGAGFEYVESSGGILAGSDICGQELNYDSWRLAKMNLAIHGIDASLLHGDSLRNDRHPHVKAECVLANLPFNERWPIGEIPRDDERWVYGVPSGNNANFAWLQHIIFHLSGTGAAAVVLPLGATFSSQRAEQGTRSAIIDADLVDCVIALAPSRQIAVSLWILVRNKQNPRFRNRVGETLLIDARDVGEKRGQLAWLSDGGLETIVNTYHAWRGGEKAGTYKDGAGFSTVVTQKDIQEHGYILAPYHYLKVQSAIPTDTQFRLAALSELAAVIPGCRATSAERRTRGEYLLLTGRNIVGGRLAFTEKDVHIAAVPTERFRNAIARPGDIVISTISDHRKLYIHPEGAPPTVVSSNCAIVRAPEKNDYILSYLRTHEGQEQFLKAAANATGGSVIPRLSVADLSRIRVPLLPLEEIQRLGDAHIRAASTDELIALQQELTSKNNLVDELKTELQQVKTYYEDRILKIEEQIGTNDLRRRIAHGETAHLEFKSSLRWNVRARRYDTEMEMAVLKTIAAFCNSDGGELLVGVADDGAIIGIEHDGFSNADRFLTHLQNLITAKLIPTVVHHVRAEILTVDANMICRVECERCKRGVWVIRNNEGDEVFYVRSGPSSRPLAPHMAQDYIREHLSA